MAPPRPPKQPSVPTMSHRAPAAAPARHSNGEPLAPKPGASPIVEPVPGAVNRKKQKRRQKQAARLASEQQHHNGCMCAHAAGHPASNSAHPNHNYAHSHEDLDYDSAEAYYDENESVDASHSLPSVAGEHEQHNTAARKAKKKKGRNGRADSQTIPDGSSASLSTHSTSTHPLPPPLPPHVAPRAILKSAKDRSIWNTSTQEERENIKSFWLELGEDERRQLVKVEKDAVLKKMKEQQRHSCSCTVCGRKRTAIEEELEVLYDAYYEELEQYANTNQDSFDPDAPIVPPPRLYHPPLRSSDQHARPHHQFHPSGGRVQELPEDDDGLEEDDEEEEDDDESYSDEEFVDEDPHAPRADFFAFGNSLTVKDGILTVADDLLKNDGKHFIDMMEQLAERRMQREEDAQYGVAAAHQSFHDGHNHGPLDEDDYDDEEEDEEYDSQEEEEDYEEDEMDAMTEEQRMEEGRRMFQIFAARMFEQRVLTAYREKVAEQRQQKLIEELMEEQTRNEQRSAKKAREAQKKKDKKRLQRQAKEEEKARRDAEKAAEEAAAKAEQEKKLEDQRKKREEQRKKREAERKSQEEERARKEAEKQRRLHEERERQAEAERKQREQRERQEKEKREEARRKEQAEREAREKKAKEERDRKVQEEQARKDREAKGRDKQHLQGKRMSQSGPAPIPSNVQNSQSTSAHLTPPYPPVATPVVPKASTPAKHRQHSHQDSHTSSPMSQAASGEQPSISPRSMPLSQSSTASSATSRQGHGQQPPVFQQPQQSTPLSPLGSNRAHPPGFAGLGGLPTHPPSMPGMAPRPPVSHELPAAYPPPSGPPINQFRNLPTSSGIPPGLNGARMMPPARAFPFESGQGPPLHSQQPMPNAFSSQPGGISQAHSRQPSSSIERSPLDAYAQPFPVSRPRPITRPSSTAPQDQPKYNNYHTSQRDMDDLSAHLGSSALLDDAEPPSTSNMSQSLPGATAPGSLPHPSRASFSASSVFTNPVGASKNTNFPVGTGVRSSPWSAQPFGGFPGAPIWEVPPGSGWSNITLGSGGHGRGYPHTSRPVEIRLYVIQACNQLSNGARDFQDVEHIVRRVNQLRPQWEPAISVEEVQDICDTEGNSQNGGGSFAVADKEGRKFVKFEPGSNTTANYNNPTPGRRGSSNPGEIGSPIPGSAIGSGLGAAASSSSFHRQFSSPPTGF